jgi:hypothetical protein
MNLTENINRIKQMMGIIKEDIHFNNWSIPSKKQLRLEYQIEHELKDEDYFDSEKEFLKAVNNGKIITIKSEDDSDIMSRSRKKNYDDILRLIKSYKSYPEFRNEETLQKIYDGFKNNDKMDLPIIIEFSDGTRKVFSGNTRLDVAFQLGIEPKVLLIKSENTNYL